MGSRVMSPSMGSRVLSSSWGSRGCHNHGALTIYGLSGAVTSMGSRMLPPLWAIGGGGGLSPSWSSRVMSPPTRDYLI